LQGQVWRPYDFPKNARSTGDIELFLWKNKPYFPNELLKLDLEKKLQGGDHEEAEDATDAAAKKQDKKEETVTATVAADGCAKLSTAKPASSSSSSSSPSSATCEGGCDEYCKSLVAKHEQTIAQLQQDNRDLEGYIRVLEKKMAKLEGKQ
jgi:hypothetical protein